ncbi:MAG: hypothetical protein ABI790_14430 [Betaproteobacteria bacterium]
MGIARNMLAFCALLIVGTAVVGQTITIPQKVRLAIQTGNWTVEPGEHLYAICRLLTGGSRLGSCADEIYAQNPQAFYDGERGRLIPGARLDIPRAFRKGPDTVVPTTTPPKVLPVPEPAPPITASTAAPAAVVKPAEPKYLDALITGVAIEDDPVDASGRPLPTEPGQRFVSVEYSADLHQQQGRGRSADQSVALQVRRETENWGEWFVDAAGMHSSGQQDFSLPGGRSGGRATLYHNAFPVTEGWIANTALGVIRNPLNTAVTNSFRITLPSPLYAGLDAQLGNDSREFRVAAGNFGVLKGLSGSAFETTRGHFASTGANFRFGEQWFLGMQSMHVREVPTLPDHDSFVAAIQQELPDRAGKWSFRALADSKGQHGAWADADLSWERTRYRIGAYQLDPQLLWADAQIANDQRGAYLRVDQRGLRQSLYGGINYADSNLDRDASRGGQRSVDGFAGISLRPSRSLSLGGTLSLQSIVPHSAGGAGSKVASGSAFVSYTGPFGGSRLDVARYQVRPELTAREYVDSMGISHDWPALNGYAISSAFSASREYAVLDTTRRQSFSLALRSPATSDFHWDFALALARVDNARGTEKNVNASLSSYWQFSTNWQASTQLVWNTIDPAPPLPGATLEAFKREKRLLFTIRNERASGTPYAMLGLGRQGMLGTGGISGVVFFDENGDGVRQANERGAANLTVFLDGRIPTTTDSAGRYHFASVPIGGHTLVLLADTLPLPWTLDDEKGLKTMVPLRGEAIQDIALTRLRP